MRRRRRRDIIIELTSLLDVIMILIFMVMSENSKLIAKTQDDLNSALLENTVKNDEINELSDELDLMSDELQLALWKLDEGGHEELLQKLAAAESKLQAYEYMNDVVIVININLENKYNNTVRCLSYGSSAEAEGEFNSFEIRNDSEFNTELNKLKVYVSECVAQITADETNSTVAYMIFSYDPEKVFQNDYSAVNQALGNIEIKANNGNIRYRINPFNTNK